MSIVRLARRFAPGLLSAIVAMVALAAVGPRPVFGDEPKPAKKDSRAAAQPKEATLSAKVTPAEAKPGETVTLSVTAKVDFGWHIYGFNKTQPDDGPRVTQFDLFDPAGLTPKGEWSAAPEPERKKDESFPGLPFVEFHEGEVTWSLPLVVPADAAPGKKSIRVQAGYMICSDKTCSQPGQWTLPAVELTVVAGGDRPKADDKLAKAGAETPGPAKPARKDTRASARSTFVEVTASVEPKEAKAGGSVTLKVTAKPSPGWHIYKYSKAEAESGPMLTAFDVFDPAGLVPKGDWSASKEPTRKQDPAFPQLPFVEFHEDEVTWSLPMVVPPGTAPGTKSIRLQAGYMICSDKTCSQPGQWTLPAIALVVLPGGPAVAAGPADPAPPPPAAEAKPAATTAAAPAPDSSTRSEVERQAELGLIPFLATCAAGGLLALVMPCVWPMVPITVNFFVKQGQKKKGAATGLAFAYCLSIIGVFTAVGVLFSAFFGAASLSKLANNPWVNFGVAGLFIAFGLSLLGLFEIRLPSFLLNASAQGEGRGGFVGVMFMALTLTITSFTCTFPVVGGLLVMAAGGNYLYPIVGLLTFATVLALPFFALALSPGMLAKMPKSGDWMNAVKVVGGLVEIGAAFKFLNTAEVAFVVPREATFNAYTVLAIWVVLALVCGIYLLGLFRTDHDHEAVKVGPGRIVLGTGFLFLALFLTPALFGRPPQGSRLWYLVVGLLPADAADLKAPTGGGSSPGAGGEEKHATSTDPKVATREEVSFHGVPWGFSFEAAAEEARKGGKPILVDFTGVNCANCRLMEQEVLPRPEVVDVLKKFVTVQLYTDFVPIGSIRKPDRDALGEANLDREEKWTRETTNPLYVVVTPDEVILGAKGGKMPPGEFTKFLNDALAKHESAGKVASIAGGAR